MAAPRCVQCGRESKYLMDVKYLSEPSRKVGRRCPVCVELNWRADMASPVREVSRRR